jgi:hypothetical protein
VDLQARAGFVNVAVNERIAYEADLPAGSGGDF